MKLDFTKSLKGRLAIYFAIGIVISLLISAVASAGLVQRYIRMRTVSDLKGQVEALSRQIETDGLPSRRYFSDLETMYQTRALIVPYLDQPLQELPRFQRGPEDVQPEVVQHRFIDWDLLASGETQVAETQLAEGELQVVVVAHGLHAGSDLVAAVVLAKPQSSLQSWVPLAGWFLAAAAISLTISLILAFLLARRLSRPLHQITESASALAAGDFSHELTITGEDEIGRLADAFRHMASEVQKSQEQQKEFVINVTHELKTPLTSIMGHIQALREGVAADPAEAARSLEVASAEASRLSRLIEDLLSVARFDARQFELKSATVPVREIMASLEAGFAWQAQSADVSLEVESPEGLEVTTDPDRLRQILSNLVQNSLAHTPAGGKVTASTRIREEGGVEFIVSDSGEGIAAEELALVFDRFYRGKSGDRKAGLGLGLAISRELALALGGDLSVSSEPGKGSRFLLRLPA
jgi:signal transduction histidine kinase